MPSPLVKRFALYTLCRAAIFAATWGLLWLVGTGSFAAVLGALVLSVPVSYFVLRRQREGLTAAMQQRMLRRQSEREQLRARLRGD